MFHSHILIVVVARKSRVGFSSSGFVVGQGLGWELELLVLLIDDDKKERISGVLEDYIGFTDCVCFLMIHTF
jgi:hypothetical protein